MANGSPGHLFWAGCLLGALGCAGCPDRVIRGPVPSSTAPAPLPVTVEPPSATAPPRATPVTRGPGFVRSGPWVSFYGNAAQLGDVDRVAATYRILNIDADPFMHNFSDAQLAQLRAGGKNVVLSYLNLGSCENFRSYWASAPPGLLPCGSNTAAYLGPYDGYPNEMWMNVGDPDYQRLILEHVAPRLVARGIDGLYLDNLEVVEHDACRVACRRGGLDLVRKLREAFPKLLLVMQNATSEVTREGVTGDILFPTLLDGVAHEEVYNPSFDESAEAQMLEWQALGLRSREGRPFWLAIEDYVGSCRNESAARHSFQRGQAHGFAVYVSDESGGQKRVCTWSH